MDEFFKKRIVELPTGSFYCVYKGSKYLAIKQLYNKGKIIKIYAKELKGNDIVSGNYFSTIKKGLLKPCEMSEEKVIDFVSLCEVL